MRSCYRSQNSAYCSLGHMHLAFAITPQVSPWINRYHRVHAMALVVWQVVAVLLLPVTGFIGDIPRARASGASDRTLLQRLFTASSTPAMAHAAYTPSPTPRNGHTESPLLHSFSPPSRAIAAIQARCQWTVPVSSFMLRPFPQTFSSARRFVDVLRHDVMFAYMSAAFNGDISGRGVRVSFYAQSAFLGAWPRWRLLFARPRSWGITQSSPTIRSCRGTGSDRGRTHHTHRHQSRILCHHHLPGSCPATARSL
jgi:hypothetical protein